GSGQLSPVLGHLRSRELASSDSLLDSTWRQFSRSRNAVKHDGGSARRPLPQWPVSQPVGGLAEALSQGKRGRADASAKLEISLQLDRKPRPSPVAHGPWSCYMPHFTVKGRTRAPLGNRLTVD